jgi:hypothetical protein
MPAPFFLALSSSIGYTYIMQISKAEVVYLICLAIWTFLLYHYHVAMSNSYLVDSTGDLLGWWLDLFDLR